MSRRYGRNQRRAHRERIERQLADLHAIHRDYVQEGKKRDALEAEMNEWNDEIIRLLGHHTAFQRITPSMVMRDVHEFMRLPVEPGQAGMRVVRDISSLPGGVRAVQMEKLFAAIKQHRDTLRTYLRIKIEDGKESRIAISDEQLHQVGLTPRDVAYFTRELVNHMNREHLLPKESAG